MSLWTAKTWIRGGVGAALGLAVMAGMAVGTGCGGKESDPVPPDPPVVTSPAPQEAVGTPLTVTGTGEVSARVAVTLTDSLNVLALGNGVVDNQGVFSVELSYMEQSKGSPLQVEVVLANDGGSSAPVTIDLVQAGLGNTYATAAEAPSYQGADYSDMQIYDVVNDVYLDELALLEALDDAQVVYFGEQHETAPIHQLQLWMLVQLVARHDDVTLAMEHFQADEQSVLDDYIAGEITDSQLISLGEVWPEFATYWKPLVDYMKARDRPVVATNIPADALDSIYANGLSSPLTFFNSWDASSPHDPYLPPRPVPAWNALYQDYFETGFDYATHGQNWGLTYQQALDYFTDLAILRDHCMGYWVATHVEDTGNRVLFVGGDWHVQTGIATPDVAATWSTSVTHQVLITTTPRAAFEPLRTADFQGRAYADYILLYD